VVLRLLEKAGDFVSDDIWHRVVQLVTNNQSMQQYAARNVVEVLKRGAADEVRPVAVGGMAAWVGVGGDQLLAQSACVRSAAGLISVAWALRARLRPPHLSLSWLIQGDCTPHPTPPHPIHPPPQPFVCTAAYILGEFGRLIVGEVPPMEQFQLLHAVFHKADLSALTKGAPCSVPACTH